MNTDNDPRAESLESAGGLGRHRPVSRRTLLVGAALGAAAAALPTSASAAPDYSVVPKLPGEVSRLDTQTTSVARRKYEAVDIVFSGDTTRLFIPHGVQLGKAAPPVTLVWFYHSFGSTHTALSAAYKWSAMLAADKGWVSICPSFGGPDQWVNSRAVWFQREITRYVNAYVNVKQSFGRANSGGGSLMSYAYAKRYVPSPRGMYLVNATYDMEDLFARDPARVGPAYGGDPALVAATNPAKLYYTGWSGARIKALVSSTDSVVPPAKHGQALVSKAAPVATQATLEWHTEGHYVPSAADSDCIKVFATWSA